MYSPPNFRFIILLRLLGALVFFASTLFAAPDDNWDSRFDALGVNGEVRAIAVSGTNVYVGGYFITTGTSTNTGIARWDGLAWHSVGGGVLGSVETIAVATNGDVYVGGEFKVAGSINATNIAKWNGSTWSSLGSGCSRAVRAIAIADNGDVFAGGDFSTAGGLTVGRIARWNGASWNKLAATNLNDSAYAIAISGTNVFVGGFFDKAGGVTVYGIARWNGVTWSSVGGGVDLGVWALAAAGTNLYAGGLFGEAGSASASNIARWNGSSWSAMGSGVNDMVNSISVAGTNVYVAGDFTQAGSTVVNRITKWNGSTWSTFGSGLNNGASAVGLAIAGSDLYVGGIFTTAGGKPSRNFARWNDTLPAVSVTGIVTNTSEATLAPLSFTVTRFGATTVPLTVTYTQYGTAASGSDYIPPSGTIVIPAGSNTASFAITPLDDSLAECAETVIVAIVPGVDYTVGPGATATATIADNELPSVGVLASDSVAAEPGTDTGTFNIYRGGCTDTPLTVNYTLTGTASNGLDYTLLSGAITIPAGSVSANIIVTPLDDVFAEPNETITLTISGGAYTIDPANPSAAITLLDNDVLGLNVSPTDIIVPEPGSETFTVALTAPPSSNVIVSVARTSGSSVLSVAGGATLTFTSGNWNTPQNVTISSGTDPDTANNTATFTVSSPGLTSRLVGATQADKDTLSVLASTSAVNVPEGNTATFTAVLTAQPAADLIVTVARTSGSSNLSVTGGATLTFTTGNWNTPQTVTIGSANDPDAVPDSANFTLSSPGFADANVTATQVEKDTLGLTVTPAALNVSEAGSTNFTVVLTAQPTNNITVTVTRTSGSTNLTVAAGGTLTFTTGNWNTPQTVTLASANDPNAVNDTAFFTVASTGLTSKTVNATQLDDDVLDVLLSTATLSVAEGGSTNYTAVLTAQPTNNITVTTTRTTGSTNLTLTGGATLTFTPGNWNTPQPITVSAANDLDAAVDTAVFTSASTGLPNHSITVSSIEDDTLALLISTNAVTISEGGANNITVVLTAQPTNNVTVTTARTSGSTNLIVTTGATLTFTPGNWNTPQTITFNSSTTPDIINDTAVFTVASAGMTSLTVNATEQDTTVLGMTAAPASVNVAEGGTNTFTIVLTAIPTNTITVTTSRSSGSANLNLIAGGTLTFTAGNWNVPQTVTIASTAAPDIVNDVAIFTATSAGMTSRSVTVTEVDGDALNFSVTPSALTWPEGTSTNFNVVLTAQPTGTVTVTTVRSSGAANLNVSAGGVLVFDAGNWNVPQTVTLTSSTQPDIVNDTAAFTVSSAGMADQTVNATETDQTTLALNVSTTALNVAESGTNTFTVVLTAIPTNTVTVNVTHAGGSTVLSVATGSVLVFTAGNWNVPQTVVIQSASESDIINDVATFSVAATGLTTQNVTATQLDSSTMGFAVSNTALSVLEGGSNTFTVVLTAIPTNTITITSARTAGSADITVAGGATLTFNSGNWNAPQPVTIACAEDADTANDTGTITVSSAGLPNQTVIATSVDNDTLGLNVSPLAVNITEGGTGTFGVSLTAEPPGSVTVNAARTSGATNLNITAGATLAFTPVNWNVPQTVTLNSTAGSDIVNDVAEFTVSSTGLVSQVVMATELDQTSLSFTLSTNAVAVAEGGSNTVTVVLTAIPTNTITISTARTSGSTNLSVSAGATLTFTAGNWNTPQAVTLAAANDFDAVPDAAVFTVTGLGSKTVTATQTEKDTLGLVVAPGSLNIVEGSTTNFTVKLSAQPTNNVSVSTTRASGATTLNVVSGGVLTFTPGNWNATQLVTLGATAQPDIVNDAATFTVAATGMSNQTVTLTELDQNTLGITVAPGSLSVVEGATTNFTVALTAIPTNTITVSTARTGGSSNLAVSAGSTLTFTAGNWNTPQPVAVQSTTSPDIINDVATFTASSPGLIGQTASVTELDTTVLAFTVSTNALAVVEGQTNQFTAVLTAIPTNNIIVQANRLSGSTNLVGVPGPASATFTPANWNVPQPLLIRALVDPDAINDAAVFRAVSASVTNTYDIAVTQQDVNTLALAASTNAVAMLEGQTNQFTVVLTAQPTNNVTVNVTRTSGSANLALIAGSTLTFTPGNWNTPQLVRIASLPAPDIVNDTATFTVSATGFTNLTVVASETDVDEVDFTVSSSSLAVPETGTNNFSIVLTAIPTNTITITTTRSNGASNLVVVAGGTLTFTSGDWNTPQQVAIACLADLNAYNGSADFTVASAGLSNRTVSVTEQDKDTLAFLAVPSAVGVNEGTSTNFTIKLTAQPTNNITATTTRTGGTTNLSVSAGGTLTFTPANWNTPQPVTIASANDPNAINDAATFTISGGGLTNATVAVTEKDKDTLALNVMATAITVTEGGSNTFTVALAAQPTNNLTVTTTRASGSTNLYVKAGGTLTFTPATWNVAQSVSIGALGDPDAANDSAMFAVASTGLTTRNVSATQLDTNVQGIVVSTTSLNINQGATNSFGVTLNAQPLTNVTVVTSRSSGSTNLVLAAGGTLTFTPGNWNVSQAVSVAALSDPDTINDVAVITLSSESLPPRTVAATQIDPDVVTLVVSTNSLAIPEGASRTLTVALQAQPVSSLTVNITKLTGGDAGVGATPLLLTFTTGNWNTPQIVTITAAEDFDAINGEASFSVNAIGLTNRIVMVRELDNDTQYLDVVPKALALQPSGNAKFRVRLAAQPTNNVSVSVERHSGDTDITVTGPASLEFTSDTWNTFQEVGVAAGQSMNGVNGTAVIRVSAAGFASQDVRVHEYAQFASTYAGLAESDPASAAGAGFMSLKMASNGSASGKFYYGGVSYSLKTQFDAEGKGGGSVPRTTGDPLMVALQLDLVNSTDQITGTISDRVVTSEVLLNRAATGSAGAYTFLMLPTSSDSGVPQGDGFATLGVSATGSVKFKGATADGLKPKTQKAAVSKFGTWPLYAVYPGGSLSGWLTLTNGVTGTLHWFKTGLSTDLEAVGSLYTLTAPVLSVSNTTCNVRVVGSDGLETALTLPVDNKVVLTGCTTNITKFTLKSKTGEFKGTLLHPVSGLSVPFQGVLIQEQNGGGGYFLHNGQSGFIELEAAP